MKNKDISTDFYKKVARFGARDMEICMKCGNFSASCSMRCRKDALPQKMSQLS